MRAYIKIYKELMCVMDVVFWYGNHPALPAAAVILPLRQCCLVSVFFLINI